MRKNTMPLLRIRCTCESGYSLVKFEYIVPRRAVFSAATIPSPDELVNDVYFKDITLGAVQIIDVAMQPYRSRRPRPEVLENLRDVPSPVRGDTIPRQGPRLISDWASNMVLHDSVAHAQPANAASVVISTRSSRRYAPYASQPEWRVASTACTERSSNETAPLFRIAMLYAILRQQSSRVPVVATDTRLSQRYNFNIC